MTHSHNSWICFKIQEKKAHTDLSIFESTLETDLASRLLQWGRGVRLFAGVCVHVCLCGLGGGVFLLHLLRLINLNKFGSKTVFCCGLFTKLFAKQNAKTL